MPVLPPRPRHSLENLSEGFRISIPSKKNWFAIPFISAWLVFWSMGGMAAIQSLFGPYGPSAFLTAWLVLWFLGAIFAVYVLLWQLLGNEVLFVTAQSITVNRQIAKLGFPQEYLAEHIANLRALPTSSTSDRWTRVASFYGLGEGMLAFDYGAKTIRTGSDIDEAEARMILEIITRQYPQYGRKRIIV